MKNARKKMFVAVVAQLVVGQMLFAGDDPYADRVVSYVPGSNPSGSYQVPLTSLGPPERCTGEGVFPGVVSQFQPPFGTDELVSIGAEGHLTVEFNTPVTDDPNNPYGIDLIVFGNTGFIDSDYPNSIVGGTFGNDGGIVEVSSDGKTWHLIPGLQADGLMPSVGYLDSGPYDEDHGTQLTDFTRPVDPALTLKHVSGDTHSQLMEKYNGSGGGVGIDISVTGLSEISFVRITQPVGADDGAEIDAFADVAPRLPGDANFDGLVDVNDLRAVILGWGVLEPGDVPADFDNDRDVDVNDMRTVILNWSGSGK